MSGYLRLIRLDLIAFSAAILLVFFAQASGASFAFALAICAALLVSVLVLPNRPASVITIYGHKPYAAPANRLLPDQVLVPVVAPRGAEPEGLVRLRLIDDPKSGAMLGFPRRDSPLLPASFNGRSSAIKV